MKNPLIFILSILLFSCNQSGNNGTTDEPSKTTAIESGNDDSVDMRSLFNLSPLSIFEDTTEGLTSSEKDDLLKNGESASWKIVDEGKSKLTIQSKQPSSEVTLRFLKNKDNLDGVLFAEVVNGENTNLISWKYSNDDKNLQEANLLKKYSANDFVRKEDKLPDSYEPVLQYSFIDDETIEVSLYTWMEKEFENREIINRVLLKWNGENLEEKIVNIGQGQETSQFNILDKPKYDLSKLSYDGKIVHKRFWNDTNGENIVLFTKRKGELFVYHFTIKSDNVKELRKVYDFEKDCEYDLTLEFIDDALTVTDLDNNSIGEITFAYKKGCISDVSPIDLKLLMLENGNKFIIRGTTVIDAPNLKMGGDKNVDNAFKNAPDNFLSHANKIWESINK